MRVWYCDDHDYKWPVGVCSVVVAHSEDEGRGLLRAALHEASLNQDKPFTLKEIPLDRPFAKVILDGEY